MESVALRVTTQLGNVGDTLDKTATSLEAAGDASTGFAVTIEQAAPTLHQVDDTISTMAPTLRQLQVTLGGVSLLGATPFGAAGEKLGQVATQLEGLQGQVSLLADNLTTEQGHARHAGLEPEGPGDPAPVDPGHARLRGRRGQPGRPHRDRPAGHRAAGHLVRRPGRRRAPLRDLAARTARRRARGGPNRLMRFTTTLLQTGKTAAGIRGPAGGRGGPRGPASGRRSWSRSTATPTGTPWP